MTFSSQICQLRIGTLSAVFIATSSLLLGQSDGSKSTESDNAMMGSVSRGSFRSVLRPVQDLRLSSRAAGVLEKIHLTEGQEVKAGGAILTLDSDQEKAEVQQAEAASRGAKIEAARTEAEFERIRPLNAQKIYSEKQLIDARAQAELASSRVEQAEASLALARARLSNRTVASPINGIFLKTNKSIGEAIERFETVARVVDISSLEMIVYCDSQYVTLFRQGDTAKIRVLKNAESQPIVIGKIVHIDPIVDPSSGTFRVKLQLPRSPDAAPGFSAVLIPPAIPTQLSSLAPMVGMQ